MKASTARKCNANKNSLDGGKSQHDDLYLVASLHFIESLPTRDEWRG